LIGAAMMLPFVYLIVRAFDASDLAWQLLFRIKTLHTLFNTLVLTIGVVFVSILISLPMAWLTVRTDLPLRRFWSVLGALPIVIPSYVGAFLYITVFGPKALFQQLLEITFGIERRYATFFQNIINRPIFSRFRIIPIYNLLSIILTIPNTYWKVFKRLFSIVSI